jgi:hypothetical protein
MRSTNFKSVGVALISSVLLLASCKKEALFDELLLHGHWSVYQEYYRTQTGGSTTTTTPQLFELILNSDKSGYYVTALDSSPLTWEFKNDSVFMSIQARDSVGQHFITNNLRFKPFSTGDENRLILDQTFNSTFNNTHYVTKFIWHCTRK